MCRLQPITADGASVGTAVGVEFNALPPREAVLGAGKYGTVWRAMDTESGEWYAVKVGALDPNTRRAAERECEIVGFLRVAHPCIVHYFNAGMADTFFYVVME